MHIEISYEIVFGAIISLLSKEIYLSFISHDITEAFQESGLTHRPGQIMPQ